MKRLLLSPCLPVVALTTLFLLTVNGIQAQPRSNTTGIYLNAHLNGTSIAFDSDDVGDLFENNTQTGGGLGVQIGYGVSRLVTIYLGIDGAVIDTDEIENAYTLAHVDAGVHLNFGGPRSATIPYLNLAFTFRQATVEVGPVEVDFTGGGVTGGGGLKFFLSRTVALDLGAAATIGTFSEVEAGTLREEIDVGAVSGRLMLGVSLFPSR